MVKKIKPHVKQLSCLVVIVETDASNFDYYDTLKPCMHDTDHENILRFHLGGWNTTQEKYGTIKKIIYYTMYLFSNFIMIIYNRTQGKTLLGDFALFLWTLSILQRNWIIIIITWSISMIHVRGIHIRNHFRSLNFEAYSKLIYKHLTALTYSRIVK